MNTDLLVYEATAIRYVLRADLDMTTPDLPWEWKDEVRQLRDKGREQHFLPIEFHYLHHKPISANDLNGISLHFSAGLIHQFALPPLLVDTVSELSISDEQQESWTARTDVTNSIKFPACLNSPFLSTFGSVRKDVIIYKLRG
jgi:hypothetical protein